MMSRSLANGVKNRHVNQHLTDPRSLKAQTLYRQEPQTTKTIHPKSSDRGLGRTAQKDKCQAISKIEPDAK